MKLTRRGSAIRNPRRVNPKRKDLLENLRGKGIPLLDIVDLKRMAEEMTGIPAPIPFGERIIGVVEYRDGTVIDVIRQRL